MFANLRLHQIGTKSSMLCAAFALVGLLACSNLSFAQNLSGTFVGNQGAEATLTHNGSSITTTNWGGPANPNLRGSMCLTGGPTEFRGTWQNSMADWRGNGTVTFRVINKDLIFVYAEGTVTYRGVTSRVRDSGYMSRKK